MERELKEIVNNLENLLKRLNIAKLVLISPNIEIKNKKEIIYKNLGGFSSSYLEFLNKLFGFLEKYDEAKGN